MPHFNESSALLFKCAVESGIESPAELANLMGNASVETQGFTTMNERLGYSSVDNVVGAVKSAATRYSREEIQAAVDSHDPKEVAKMLYEGRSDLGNTEVGDGYKFHGRGYLQYTGRDNYTTYGNKFGVDLADHPEKAADPETAAKLAIAFWNDKIPDKYREDAKHAGAIINGGPNGASERVSRSEAWKGTITPEMVQGVKDGTIDLKQLAALGVDEHAKRHPKSGAEPQPGDTMRKGDHGKGVDELQTKLDQLGYKGPKGESLVNAGHNFGPMTYDAVREFQRANGLKDDGIAGPATHKAIDARLHEKTPAQETAAPPKRLDDVSHPDNPMYEQARSLVYAMDREQGRVSDQRSDNLASSATVAARAAGIQRIDTVALSDDANKVWIGQGMNGMRDHITQSTSVDTVKGLNTTMEQSATQWAQAAAQSPQKIEQAPEQSQQQVNAQQVGMQR